jgi:hypothetical protein
VADLFSRRFGKNVWITRHARSSMLKRGIDDETLERVIEEGEIKRKNDIDMWVYAHVDGRQDNLICAAAVEASAVVIKTVMINWELEDEV